MARKRKTFQDTVLNDQLKNQNFLREEKKKTPSQYNPIEQNLLTWPHNTTK